MVIHWRHVWPLILYAFCFVFDATAIVTTKSRDGISNEGNLQLLSWAIQVSLPDDQVHNVPAEILDTKADVIAAQINLINAGQIGTLKGHYLLHHAEHYQHERNNTVLIHAKNNNFTKAVLPPHWGTHVIDSKDWNSLKDLVHNFLESNPDVLFYSQQVVRQRFKRSLKFLDPAYPRQWHLHNDGAHGMDINVVRVWERNITGRGVTAAVVDDGLDWHNPDLYVNYNMDASWDLNDKDSDPSPTVKSEKNHHGTRCAGEIAAAANTACAIGVAYNAKIAGLKVLDGPMTDSLEAEAFTKNIHKIDVYSCSWGPDDDGKTVDGPHHLAVKAMMYSVEYGRNGYGSIFVVASGNGGTAHDNCNFDGYANSIYTITIGAVDELGAMPYYAEECASMLAVTFSSGGLKTRNIVTTDWTSAGGTGCTDDHSGTSAAAPLAAGMIALMLDVQPCLTWRDVQHIIVMAAKKVDVDVAHWQKNAAGFHHSHKHGFGLMDAWRLVNAAKLWKPVPWMTLFTSEEMHEKAAIPGRSQPLVREYHVTKEKLDGFNLYTLEYVHATVTVTHERRGDVEVKLHCPSGTVSTLAATRKLDVSEDGFKEWTFSTVRCWGETPQGTWKIIITDKGKSSSSRGVLVKWQLQLYGSPMSSEEVQERKRLVEKASKGDHLFDNHTAECAPPPLRNHLVKPMSEKILKIIVLTSAFCFLMSLYESFEYIFCYNEEKKEHKRQMRLAARAQREAQRQGQQQQQSQSEDNTGESTRLLDAEEIPLQTIPPSSYNSSSVGEDKIFDPTEYGSRSSRDNLSIPKTNTDAFDRESERSVVNNVKAPAGTSDTTGATYGSDLIASGTLGATARCSPYIPESFLQGNGEVPNEMLTCLTPEEIRLNMSLRDESSDEELVFEAKTS